MSLTIQGKVKQIGSVESGTSKAGKAWQKQSIVVEYPDGSYTKEVQFGMMGDKIEQIAKLSPGQAVTVHFSVSSREFNSKWYTSCDAWKIEAGQAESVVPAKLDEQVDDLPF